MSCVTFCIREVLVLGVYILEAGYFPCGE